jgi:hypothetical protein
MSMKISSDAIGNRRRDLPACSAVPQPTALPRPTIQWVPGLFHRSTAVGGKIITRLYVVPSL